MSEVPLQRKEVSSQKVASVGYERFGESFPHPVFQHVPSWGGVWHRVWTAADGVGDAAYRGTSLITNRRPLGPYSSICLGPYGGPRGGGGFL